MGTVLAVCRSSVRGIQKTNRADGLKQNGESGAMPTRAGGTVR